VCNSTLRRPLSRICGTAEHLQIFSSEAAWAVDPLL
jgi:hypothetical protein